MDSNAKAVRHDISNGVKDTKDYSEAMLAYREYCIGNSVDKEFECAFSIIKDEIKKEILEALLLADAEYEDINSVFDIPIKSIEVYAELFFDTSTFFTKLDNIS
jgi:hypothetical protein